MAFGCLDSSGGAYRWFRDTLAKEESYDDLNEMAKETPEGAEKLFFYPYLVGERTLGSVYSRGMFIGLSPRHTKGHMVRSIQEGIAFKPFIFNGKQLLLINLALLYNVAAFPDFSVFS